MTKNMLVARCPVCSHAVAAPFFNGGRQPLATLGWPESEAAALAMARFPLEFVQCPKCSHVWNRLFDYESIPYRNNPNRMFNAGSIWQGHLADTRDLLARKLPENPIVAEIGCGEGHFLRGLSALKQGKGRFVGFDPNATVETGRGVEFHARYFNPLEDMPDLAPDAVIMRHVLEHLTDASTFVEQLAWGAQSLDKPVWLFAEVPCIDRVFETGRLADFFYEHVSHFTTQSFRFLMARAGDVADLSHGYDGEVVYALVSLGVPAVMRERARTADSFARQADVGLAAIRAQLDELARQSARVVIWGGTGKAAAFIHQFGVDAARFPWVVDSDPDKAGTYVPGTGQKIQYRDVLESNPVDVVIIPTQWRAKDIVAEMQRQGISAKTVLIEHQGRLIDFLHEPNPYR